MIGAGKNFDLSQTDQALRKTSGSLAIFAAVRRASSLLSNLAADRRPSSGDGLDINRRTAADLFVANSPYPHVVLNETAGLRHTHFAS